MTLTDELTRAQTGVKVWPSDHFTGQRLSRRGFQASLVSREGLGREGGATPADVHRWCPHSHRTVQAAVACGKAMWKALPS